MIHVMSFNKSTLMNNSNDSISLIKACQCYVRYGFNFEGVTTWYQSVPGLNTLGTWDVISITVGSSRLI